MKVLITGFGSFPGVPRNPSLDLIHGLEGKEVAGARLFPHEIPVSWVHGPEHTVTIARELGVDLVIGIGVAMNREAVTVERQARRTWSQTPDTDGLTCSGFEGPTIVPATLDVERLAEAMGAQVSEDAGEYVCNAWLYHVARDLEVPVGFIHVPAQGMEPERLIAGVRALLEGGLPDARS